MSAVGPVAEEELFETFDEHNHSLNQLVKRGVVHTEGLFHRSSNVFLLHPTTGKLLIQRRMPEKRVCPNCWDLSVGEHLQPRESYLAAAVRGLGEELEINLSKEEIESIVTLGEPRLLRFEEPRENIRDFEFTQNFLIRYGGHYAVDKTEVAEAKFVDIKWLEQELKMNPSHFTPWLKADFERLKAYKAQE